VTQRYYIIDYSSIDNLYIVYIKKGDFLIFSRGTISIGMRYVAVNTLCLYPRRTGKGPKGCEDPRGTRRF
jgi:hypothetical protein